MLMINNTRQPINNVLVVVDTTVIILIMFGIKIKI